jgi:hypothetical protein
MHTNTQPAAAPVTRRIHDTMVALGYIGASITANAGGIALNPEFTQLRAAFATTGALTNAFELVGNPDKRVIELLTFPNGRMDQRLVFQDRIDGVWTEAGQLTADEFLHTDAALALRGATDPLAVRLAEFLDRSGFQDCFFEAKSSTGPEGQQVFSGLSRKGRFPLELCRLRLNTVPAGGDYTLIEEKSTLAEGWKQTRSFSLETLLNGAHSRQGVDRIAKAPSPYLGSNQP